jgi:very-short-patch-repair endonuclease
VADAVLGSTVSTDDLDRRLTTWLKSAGRITEAFTPRRAEEVADDLRGDFADVRVLLDALADTVGDIEEWAAHVAARTTLERAGLEPVVSFCAERKISGDQVAPVVSRALLEAWADDVLASNRDRLGALRAVDRDALVAEFRALDREQIASAAARIINACANRRPTSRAGEAGIIERQAGIDRRHMPIRTLLDRAGRVAQQLKPCFMMSPLSVSQYLPPSLRFDTVIFDEASQVKPSDAVNCVYRGHQLIVAGDQKQLPPTSFGQRIGTVDDDTYDEDQLDEFESLLDLCKAGALGSLPLNWHYRSKHEALITYSNYEFYSGGLLTFPGATDEAPDVGIELFKVDGVYRRGGARDNPVEAAKVVERVLYHRRHHPDRTLGVVTFSGAQEDAIEREVERQTRQYPELAGLDTDDRLHGFFVKNLENVQGDERDIIIFSVGYGPDEHGKFTMSMGPLTWKMGWRRLNVAITRAKSRVEIVTSVLPEQFSSAAASLGVQHLRKYLDFARRGIAALALDLDESSGDAESPFEEEVLRSIRGWGYEAVPQVGVAGYRIDIGIRDPARPGAFVLGVECDGAMYHSSKVARDRDRLRQQVLEGLGWRIHRIWGTAWYRDRTAQEARLRDAIEGRVTGPVREAHVAEAPAVHHESVDLDAPPSWTVPYRPAEISVRTSNDMHDPAALSELRRLVEDVVRQEGPVHEDRVLRVVRDAWGVGRAVPRIREAFTIAVRVVTRSTIDKDNHGFLKISGQSFNDVRIPTDDSRTKREIKHIPREELRHAVRRIVADAHTITHDELSRHVARLFGWQRRGPDIRAILDEINGDLLRSGDLREVDGNLTGGLADVEQPPVPPTAPARTSSRVLTPPAGLRPRRRPHH